MQNNDEIYMQAALAQARLAYTDKEVPVGAVIVRDDRIVGSGFNRREGAKNALCHAEILAIDSACRQLGGWRLPGCTLYVTLEPCMMCAGAILNARIERVVFGCADVKNGAFGSVFDANSFFYNHRAEVTAGILQNESTDLLQGFFKMLRERQKNGSIV